MKKILVGLMAVLSVSAVAEMTKDYNISVLGGLNFFNSPQKLEQKGRVAEPSFTWKSSDDASKNFAAGYVYSNSMIDSMKDIKKLLKNSHLKLELTKNYNENVEYGLGFAYIFNQDKIQNISTKDFKDNATKNIDFLSNGKIPPILPLPFFSESPMIDNDLKTTLTKYNEEYTSKLKDFSATFYGHKYNSIPVYGTVKYKFVDKFENVTPYVKADLGYSFSVNYSKEHFDYKVTHQDENNEATKIINEQFKKEQEKLSAKKFEAKNGLYASLGFGVEYNNFLAELSAAYVGGSLVHTNGDTKTKINNGDLKLMTSVGYKF